MQNRSSPVDGFDVDPRAQTVGTQVRIQGGGGPKLHKEGKKRCVRVCEYAVF